MDVEVKPSQAAREAAVKLLFPQGTAAWYDAECDFYILRHRMEAGLEDDHPYVQAFACLEASAFAAGRKAGLVEAWQPIETAPKDADILVWFDHDADPYQDPANPNKLTAYAACAEGGDYLEGKGWAIAKHFPAEFQTEDEYGSGYWVPAAWFAREDGDYARVVNPLFWQPLPPPPAIEERANAD